MNKTYQKFLFELEYCRVQSWSSAEVGVYCFSQATISSGSKKKFQSQSSAALSAYDFSWTKLSFNQTSTEPIYSRS